MFFFVLSYWEINIFLLYLDNKSLEIDIGLLSPEDQYMKNERNMTEVKEKLLQISENFQKFRNSVHYIFQEPGEPTLLQLMSELVRTK